jgi:hypothetical protein
MNYLRPVILAIFLSIFVVSFVSAGIWQLVGLAGALAFAVLNYYKSKGVALSVQDTSKLFTIPETRRYVRPSNIPETRHYPRDTKKFKP